MTMKTTTILLCAALLLGACGGNAARNRKSAAATRITVPAAPREYTYRVKAVHPHATDAYTQGLQYVDGTLWEGTGQHGASRVMKTDLGTGRTELFARLPRSEFGEGITLLDGRLYYLTWQSNTAHVYDVATGRHLRDFRYPGEGWGLTTDGERLYATRFGLERNPEEWFSSQSSVEEVARTEAAVDPDNYRVTINAHEGYNVYMTNGVHYVTAKENDTYENIGRKFRISARNLRKFNDLKDKQAQPMTGEVVYIERKKKRWEGNARHHICRQGETVYAVGQSYAIRSRSIERLNKLKPGERLEEGRQLRIK